MPIENYRTIYQLTLKPKPRFRMVISVDLGYNLALVPNLLIDGTVGYFMKFLLQNM